MNKAVALSYWESTLDESFEDVDFPSDYPRYKTTDDQLSGTTEVSFSRANALIEQIAQQCHVLPEAVCVAVLSMLVFRYTGKTQFSIGYVCNDLSKSGFESTASESCFPIGVHIHTDDSPRHLIAQIAQAFTIGDIYGFKDFDRVASTLDVGSRNNSNTLCKVTISCGEIPIEVGQLSGTELFLSVLRQNDESVLATRYSEQLYKPESIQRLITHYMQLVESTAAELDSNVATLKMLGMDEYEYLVNGLNDSAQAYPSDSTIMDLFMEQALRSPDSLAVRDANELTLTYQELDEASNRLARYLREKGADNTHRIGVFLERGTQMMIALFGVMKSGASYVPLDPMFPADRLAFMADDAGLQYVLTSTTLATSLSSPHSEVLMMDILSDDLSAVSSEPIQLSDASDEVYVIYTSGSTGTPKGVQIGQQALTNFMLSVIDEPGIDENDRVLAVTTLSFDIASIELYAPLLVGAQVILASREQAMSPALLSGRIKDVDATFMSVTPSTWKLLLNSGWPGSVTLKVLCGGEPLSLDVARELIGTCKELWNMYGPTETTVYSSTEKIEASADVITVGKPMANTSFYVLDASENLVPAGVRGELYIGGDGVGIGYLGRTEQTAERFLPDPFKEHGARMYRTGDGARWRDVGTMEILGRLDDQVKLRGFRIEPGEIRARLVELDLIKDAVVIVREDDGAQPRLVAYLLPETQTEIPSIQQMRLKLLKTLPEYMVPEAWVILKKLPQTPNGKLDIKQLPAPDKSSEALHADFVLPRSQSEHSIAKIWKDELNLDEVGVLNNFFELGGQSLLAFSLVSELRDKIGLDVPLVEIFQGATIASLALHLDGLDDPEAALGVCRLLTSAANDKPVFIVGSNPRFKSASASLDGMHPVYQIDSYAFMEQQQSAKQKKTRSIEELATVLLLELKQIQPSGPYIIGGGCEGALIAFEMALILQRSGDEVQKLMLWHTTSPGPGFGANFGEVRLRSYRWIRWRVGSLLGNVAVTRIGIRGLRQLARHAFLEYVLFQATQKYRPTEKFKGDIELILLDQMEAKNSFSERTMGWKDYMTGTARLYELKGTHETWLDDHGEAFGEYLQKTMHELNSTSP